MGGTDSVSLLNCCKSSGVEGMEGADRLPNRYLDGKQWQKETRRKRNKYKKRGKGGRGVQYHVQEYNDKKEGEKLCIDLYVGIKSLVRYTLPTYLRLNNRATYAPCCAATCAVCGNTPSFLLISEINDASPIANILPNDSVGSPCTRNHGSTRSLPVFATDWVCREPIRSART